MSVYRKFDRNDILFSTIHTRPKVSVKFGENGWEGSTGISASLSLYGGVRSRRDVRSSDFDLSGISIFPLDPVDTHSIDKVIFVSGSYPSTGSIRFIRCRDMVAPTPASIDQEHWFEEHFRPLDLLYDFYGRHDSNYFRGSYDFYTPLFLVDAPDPNRPGPYVVFSGTFQNDSITGPTSSFTVEAWVKLVPNGTSSDDFTNPVIFGQQGIWNVFVDQNNRLAVGTELAPFTASSPLSTIVPGVWTHIAVAFSSSVSASLWVDGQLRATVPVPGGVLITGSELYPLVVGSHVDYTGRAWDNGWNGFLAETRVWSRILSSSEIIHNSSGTLINSSSDHLLHYARYNDGPYGSAHGFVSGSGAFDYSPGAHHGQAVPWSGPNKIHWQPSDHPTFVPVLKKINTETIDIRVVHVPSMFYGRQIDPGSVRITDGVYNDRKIVRVLNDDGRGTIYVSGSYTRDVSGEQYTGERRRKVGNVFYTEGLIVLDDPALHDMFDNTSFFWDPEISVSGVFGDLLAVDFKGQGRINTKTFNCRLPSSQGNASNNPTWSEVDDRGTEDPSDDRVVVSRDDGTTYITAVGIYNEHRQLVAVAKFAQPIRKREKDKENLRLKMDF